MDWVLPGRTSISVEDLWERLARTCAIIREGSPDGASELLAHMLVIWASPPSLHARFVDESAP